MELSKDTYLYLTNFADDRTILNMLSVNKKFNDDNFFKQVMKRKYPLLLRYKEKQQTWKQFFISTVYCIEKIEETHNIPYYSIEGYNPKEYCNYSSKKNILNGMMIKAPEGGQIEMVKLMIEQGANDFNLAMAIAAKYGHIDIVKLMIQYGSTHFDTAMAYTAKGGHIDIVKLMIQHGATDFDSAMANSAYGGHIDIVKLMIKEGATDFDSAMANSAYGGHIDVVRKRS